MTDILTTRLPTDHCPVCESEIDAVTTIRRPDARPKPGDLTICCYCTAILTFDAALKQRAMSDAELDALPPKLQQNMRQGQALARHMIQKLGRRS